MKRNTILKLHIVASILSGITIATFFVLSLVAEIRNELVLIKKVKEVIFFSLPIMIIAMPVLNASGKMLAGQSQNAKVLLKQKRMRIILINGIALVLLATFLYYRSHHHIIDGVFIKAQIVEFVLGFANLILIGLNSKSGLQLSGSSSKLSQGYKKPRY